MKKRGDDNRVDVRTAALTSATRWTAAQGLGATSLQVIADDVGVTKQALLYYFPSKDALKVALVDHLLEEADRRFRDMVTAFAATDTGEARLNTLLDHLERYLEDHPHSAPAVLRFLLDRDEVTVARIKERARPWLEYVAGHVEEGRAAGLLRPELTAEAIFTELGLMVLAHFASLPLGGWTNEPTPPGWRRERLMRLIRTVGLVVFSDAARPALFK